MIQRIQTVYLLIVLALSITLAFVPFYQFEGKLPLNDAFIETSLLIPIAVIICLTCLGAIFTFKYRKTQKNICRVLILLQLVYLVAGFVFVRQHSAQFDFHFFRWGTLLPVVSIIFILLAINGINKDEELIRSMDRLR